MFKYDVLLYNSTKKFKTNAREHIGLAYLASALRKHGRSVKIIDSLIEDLTPELAIEEIKKNKFSIIGISFLSYGYEETKKIAALIKVNFPLVKIIVGGHFASFAYEDILNGITEVDYISIGEGDESFPNLVEAILNNSTELPEGIVSRSGKNLNTIKKMDLDTLPFPSRDCLSTVLMKGGVAGISTSRGCYGTCTFCSVHNYYQKLAGVKWRGRSPENVVDEMLALVREFKILELDIIDDNFIGPGKKGYDRAFRIAELIIAKNINLKINFDLRVNDFDEDLIRIWKKAGLKHVLIGIESIVDEDLKFYNKHITPELIKKQIKLLEKYKINYTLGTLFWHPDTKIDSVIKNIEFLNVINYIEPNILSNLNIYKGTKAEEILLDKGALKGEFYNYHWEFQCNQTQKCFELLKENIMLGYKLIVILSRFEEVVIEIYRLNQKFTLDLLKAVRVDTSTQFIVENYVLSLEALYEQYQ